MRNFLYKHRLHFFGTTVVSFASFDDFPFYREFNVLILQVPNVFAKGSAVFVFGFPESVVMIIVPQFEGTFCNANVGLRVVVVLPFDDLVNDSLLLAFSI